MSEGRLRVLIADDEKIIRDGLKHVIDWEGNGFEIIGMASNGKEALDTCLEFKPDVVITDIVMPVMGGLELISAVKKSLPDASIIILTCHSEFSYAQEAIKLGVEDYILKHSINYEELIRVLNKIKAGLAQRTNSLFPKDAYDWKSHGIIMNNILKKLTLGHVVSEDEINSIFKDRDDFAGSNVLLAVIDTCRRNISIEVFEESMASTFMESTSSDAIYYMISDDRIGYLLYTNKKEMVILQRRICEDLANIIRKLNTDYGYDIYAAVCSKLCSIEMLHKEYMEAANLLKHKFYYPAHSIIVKKDITGFKEMAGENIFLDIGQYKKDMLEANIGSISENLTNMVNANIEANMNPDIVIKQCIGFVSRCIDFFNKTGGKLEDIYGDSVDPYTLIMNANNIYEVYDIIYDLFKRSIDFLSAKSNMKHKKELIWMLRIINEEYAGDITLRDIAGRINISYNYLATIFKDEIGINFSDYLISVRIQKAKLLLTDTNLKVYEISEMVGYRDSAYFSTLFKNIELITPMEYRRIYFK